MSTRGTYQPTELAGVFTFDPVVHSDNRGAFHEWFKADAFAEALGYPFIPEQANMSTSAAGVVRGIHFADVPPGQAKLVTCPSGRATDIIVDLRRGSDTFGQHITVELGGDSRKVVYLPVGVGHAFVAHETTVIAYLTSTGYNPDAEHAVSIDDPDLGIDIDAILGGMPRVLSKKDQAAPTVGTLGDRLPRWEDCRAYENDLRNMWAESMGEA
ncbi:dTDP-4-dehydrorhamnose 3,5-epimerase [Corynebacterium sp. TAE3-ERU12]|uniref:dTDP-4-dehydrorhamnose 3,5-epimerase family protein n=1 Tax=Corynebacterium sp. TAE3-ERU12 TaxID=2849491 RepID=UPI001C4628FA|nr:dTDP-4-dehydrorhamnose 3,5-epimerase [Corynebacterium sp. TAE3-ERU12]MBV7294559.1 dTDP-4-dehydrorhamnose 3,5-epimerase [Corynebacterium sp. TAE3-ERU12]